MFVQQLNQLTGEPELVHVDYEGLGISTLHTMHQRAHATSPASPAPSDSMWLPAMQTSWHQARH